MGKWWNVKLYQLLRRNPVSKNQFQFWTQNLQLSSHAWIYFQVSHNFYIKEEKIATFYYFQGLGTILISQFLLCGKKCTYSSRLKGYFVGVLTGLMQMLLAVVVIGWFWSVWWVIKEQKMKSYCLFAGMEYTLWENLRKQNKLASGINLCRRLLWIWIKEER